MSKGESRASGPARLNLKFSADTSQADVRRAVTSIGLETAVTNVIQTFPDEEDEDLARLYLLEVVPESVASTLDSLRRVRGVEYAEETAHRRLKK